MTDLYAGNLKFRRFYLLFHTSAMIKHLLIPSQSFYNYIFDWFLKIKMFRIVSSELMFYIKSLESIDALPKEEMALQSMNDIWNENFSTNNGQ